MHIKGVKTKIKNNYMNEFKVTATFNGRDGSAGFKSGSPYNLTISIHPATGEIWIGEKTLYREPKSCIYQSILAFLKNWHNVSLIQDEKAISTPIEYMFNNDDWFISPVEFQKGYDVVAQISEYISKRKDAATKQLICKLPIKFNPLILKIITTALSATSEVKKIHYDDRANKLYVIFDKP